MVDAKYTPFFDLLTSSYWRRHTTKISICGGSCVQHRLVIRAEQHRNVLPIGLAMCNTTQSREINFLTLPGSPSRQVSHSVNSSPDPRSYIPERLWKSTPNLSYFEIRRYRQFGCRGRRSVDGNAIVVSSDRRSHKWPGTCPWSPKGRVQTVQSTFWTCFVEYRTCETVLRYRTAGGNDKSGTAENKIEH